MKNENLFNYSSEKITETYNLIKPYILFTPFIKNEFLSEKTENNIYIKYENLQHSGSFKLRGAASKLIQLGKKNVKKVVTASTGNHALATATICQSLKIECEIFVPGNCDQAKISKIKLLGKNNAKINMVDTDDCLKCEASAIKYSIDNDLPYISPYNDEEIIYGQATLGHEIILSCRELELNLDEVYVSVGGGGLIGGLGLAFKNNINTKVIGVQPANSSIMYYSVKSDRILDSENDGILDINTLSDGTAGGVDSNTITYDLCKNLVSDWVLVDEENIKKELVNFIENEQMIIEGAAALTIAGALKRIKEKNIKNKNICIVLCGRNIGINKLRKLLTI